MEWTRSDTLALAQQNCTFCYGVGFRPGRNQRRTPCNCVFRAIFRACYARFKYCATRERSMGRTTYERTSRSAGPRVWVMKDEEYVADFCLVSHRLLTASEHRIFRYYYLLDADWKLCCRTLHLERGDFFHSVYRIQQKLGRGFRELEPYPLFPVDDYFYSKTRAPSHPPLHLDVEAHKREPGSSTRHCRHFPVRRSVGGA